MTEEYMKRGMLLDSAADYLVKLRNKHKVAPAAPPQGTSGEQEDIRKNAETLRGIASATAGTLTDEVTAAANKASHLNLTLELDTCGGSPTRAEHHPNHTLLEVVTSVVATRRTIRPGEI
eukprot:5714013-Pyramimonas_sp.AAC.1